MIRSFANKMTLAAFEGLPAKRLPSDLRRVAQIKLRMLHEARRIEDLRIPPGNHLEKLSGDRSGQWSIRINSQWRICFVWYDGDVWDVEIVDYH